MKTVDHIDSTGQMIEALSDEYEAGRVSGVLCIVFDEEREPYLIATQELPVDTAVCALEKLKLTLLEYS